MNWDRLYQYLKSCIKENTLELKDGKEIEYVFTPLFAQLGCFSLLMVDPEIEKREESIQIRGRGGLRRVAGGEQAEIRIVMNSVADKLIFSFLATYKGSYNLKTFLGTVYPVYYVEKEVIHWGIQPLLGITLLQPSLSLDINPVKLKKGLSLSSKAWITGEGMWEEYGSWIRVATQINGFISLNNSFFRDIDVDYWMEIPLPGANMIKEVFPGILEEGSLAFILYRGKRETEEIKKSARWISLIEVRCRVVLKGLKTPVEISAPLFGNPGQWHFAADFQRGLSLADLAGFAASLFGFNDTGEILLPENSSLDNFRLYGMKFGFWGEDCTLRQVCLSAATANPWTLPLPFLTLKELYLNWDLLMESGSLSKNYLMSAKAGGTLLVDLGSKQLQLSANASLPEMDMEASLILKEKAGEPGLLELLGEEAAGSLPGGRDKRLSELYLWASPYNRSLELSASVKDVFCWQIGTMQIKMENLTAYAGYNQEKASLGLEGSFRITKRELNENGFSFYLSGGYNGESWYFRGGLSTGKVYIGTLLLGLLGIDYGDEKSGFALTQFALSFDTKDSAFELQAAFTDTWQLPIGNVRVDTAGEIHIKNSSIMENPYLAAMISLRIDSFLMSVQVKDFFSPQKVSYLFSVMLGDHKLQAGYTKKLVKEELHDVVTVEFVNTTLGDLVVLLIAQMNPNHRYTLPSPWNLLNKIDLSRFLLEYDLTDESISVSYRLQLKIPAILEIHSVGLRYGTDEEHPKKYLRFILTGKTLAAQEIQEYGWDAINEQPPLGLVDQDNRFHLHYLGIGNHLFCESVSSAKTITEAMEAMEASMEETVFDSNSGLIMGLHFSLEEMLDFQMVFADPFLYGLQITVTAQKPPLSMFKGLNLMVLYKKIAKDIGMFKAVLTLPDQFRYIRLGVLNFTIGILSIEIYTNGEFLLDLGFPEGTDFSRSFALEVGQFVGHGGLKFGVLGNETAVNIPKTDKGTFQPVIQLGVGLSLGIGKSFDFGVVKGGVSLELFGIFEGVFAVYHDHKGEEELYYCVTATAGIKGRLYLTADLKIIAISASVEIEAWAILRLQSYCPVLVDLHLALRLQASIRILFIKISFSFQFNADISLDLGGGGSAPWDTIPVKKHRNLRTAGFLRPQRILKNKEQVNLFVEQLYSQDGENYCMAFVPMVYTEDFIKIIDLLSEWMILTWVGKITRKEAFNVTFEEIQGRADYSVISTLFAENLVLNLEDAKLLKNKEEEEAVIFPMPPAADLTLKADGETLFTINYWEANMVSLDYVKVLSDYFESLSPLPKEDGKTVDMSGFYPLGELVFTDYFHMILRNILGRIHSFYEQFEMDGAVIFDVEEKCGLTLGQVIADNLSLKLKNTSFFVPGCVFLLETGETLFSLGERSGIGAEQVKKELEQVRNILNPVAVLFLEEYEVDNEKRNWTVLEAAAYFFVRRYGDMLVSGYEELAGIIQDLNDLTINYEWEAKEEGVPIVLPGNMIWNTMPGDTLIRLAKYCQIVTLLGKGECLAWDMFLEEIKEKNSNEEHPNKLLIPKGNIDLEGEVSLITLERRCYPMTLQLEKLPIWKTMAAVELQCLLVGKEGMCLEELLKGKQVTPFMLAEALKGEDSPFLPGQTVRIIKPPYLTKELIREILKEKEWCRETGAMISRFMFQGLRLPVPESTTLEKKETQAFYKLLGQQVNLPEKQSYTLHISRGQPGISWLAGELSRLTKWETVLPQLPDPCFQWTKNIQDMKELPAIEYGAKSYIPTSSLCLKTPGSGTTLALHYVDASMQQDMEWMDEIGLLSGRRLTGESVKAATIVPFTIHKTEYAGYYMVSGVPAPERERMRALLEYSQGNSKMTYGICYQPSPLTSEGLLYQENWKSTESFLIRANLSLETHNDPVSRKNKAETEYDFASLGSLEFLVILWECSVVGGSGYYLNLVTEKGSTLPEEIFDETGSTKIWVLAKEEEGNRLLKSGTANAVITDVNVSGGGNFGQGEYAFVPKGNLSKDLLHGQQQFPPGCVGISLVMRAPDEAALDALSRSRQLFHMISYVVEGEDYKEDIAESIPLLPGESSEENSWRYTAVIPLHRFVKGEEGIYGGLEKRPCKVSFTCRDILGNYASGMQTFSEVKPLYNDVLMGIHQWPGVAIEYDFYKEKEKIYLQIKLKPKEDKYLQYPKKAAAFLRNSLHQLEQMDVKIIGTISLFEEEWDWEHYGAKTKLQQFGHCLADYLEGKAEVPASLELLFVINEKVSKPCTKLTVNIRVERTKYLPPMEEIRLAKTEISPAIPAGEAFDQVNEVVRFARDFESYFPNTKLARMDKGSLDFYVVTTGKGGMIPHFHIRPIQVQRAGGSVTTPIYWGLAPLANRLISRETVVREFAKGVWEDKEKTVVFAHTDMDLWGDKYLGFVDELLEGNEAKRGVIANPDAISRIINGKKKLVNAIGQQLMPIEEGVVGKTKQPEAILQDVLRHSLSRGYRAASIAEYELLWDEKAKERFRLTLQVSGTDSQADSLKVESGKIDSAKNSVCFLYHSQNDARSGFPIKWTVSIPELEYKISENSRGYESSLWLTFILPIQPEDTVWSLDLTSDYFIPNPLRRNPANPSLTGQKASFRGNRLYEWDYDLYCRSELMEQDLYCFTVEFGQKQKRKTRLSKDLFDLLAQYNYIEEGLKTSLKATDEVFEKSMTIFADLTEQIVLAWEEWNRQENTFFFTENNLLTSRVCQGDVFVDFKEGAAIHVSSKWPDVTAYFLDEKETYQAGEYGDFALRIGKLNVYDYNQAVPSLVIERNANLLKVRDSQQMGRVNPRFIYKSQMIDLPELYAGQLIRREILLGTIKRDISSGGLQEAVDLLIQSLAILNRPKVNLSMVTRYQYEQQGNQVELPVFMVVQMNCGENPSQYLMGILDSWFQEYRPSFTSFRLLFQVMIYQKELLLGLENLVIEFKI